MHPIDACTVTPLAQHRCCILVGLCLIVPRLARSNAVGEPCPQLHTGCEQSAALSLVAGMLLKFGDVHAALARTGRFFL